MSCREVRDWLHRDVEALAEAQRLVLDDHLAVCARCRDDREHMLQLRRAGSSITVPPADARIYGRAIARALLEGAAPAPRRGLRPVWIAAVGLAAAAGAVAVAMHRKHAASADEPAGTSIVLHATPAPASPSTAPTVEAPAPAVPEAAPMLDVIEQGILAQGTSRLGEGAAIPSDVVLRADAIVRARLSSMRVVVAAGSELRWSSVDRTVLLDRGGVDAEVLAPVDARIATPRFEIVFRDAEVAVTTSAVHVQRGEVRVIDRTQRLLAMLGPGDTWTPPSERGLPPAKRSPAASELLADGRAAFAARDYQNAERLAERVLAGTSSRVEEAEARTMLADVAQASGALALAVARYELVAARFPKLPAGETALYAAARLELRRARSDAARVLLERYLTRYPRGRYAADARTQLASLLPSTP